MSDSESETVRDSATTRCSGAEDGPGQQNPNVQGTEPDPYIQEFLRDRDQALISLDESKIKAYLRKYGETPPENPIVFWMGVHKAITGCKSLPIEFRRKSALWLAVRGSESMDDGDLDIGQNTARRSRRP